MSQNITVRGKVLSTDEIKALSVDKQKKKILESKLDVQAIADILCDEDLKGREAIVGRFCELLSKGIDYVSFSGLEPADEDRLQLLHKGFLNVGDTFKGIKLGEEIKATIMILQERWSLKTEHGCRTLIDLFLLDAANKSKSLVGIFPEYQVEGTVGDFKVGGSLDYLVTDVDIPLGDKRRFHALRKGRAKPPFLVVIEAKKFEIFDDGVTQLVAEMKILWVNLPENDKRPIYGVLTTGTKWLFYMLDKHGIEYYFAGKSDTSAYDYVEDEEIIVSFLVNFMLHQLPAGITIV